MLVRDVSILNCTRLIGAEGLAASTSNEALVLAGTLHGIHAITSRISPVLGSSGVNQIEAETFKMTIKLTQTGAYLHSFVFRD